MPESSLSSAIHPKYLPKHPRKFIGSVQLRSRASTNLDEDEICRTSSASRRGGVIPTGGTRAGGISSGVGLFGVQGSLRNGCNGECKGMVADNILKRARVCYEQSSLAGAARTMLKRARRRENSNRDDGRGQGVTRGIGREGWGLYVKGGRARCYLACSPDEISASSFRPSSPLLPRSSPPSLPSSYTSFLFFLLCPRPPLLRLSDLPRCSCRAKTFFARAPLSYF